MVQSTGRHQVGSATARRTVSGTSSTLVRLPSGDPFGGAPSVPGSGYGVGMPFTRRGNTERTWVRHNGASIVSTPPGKSRWFPALVTDWGWLALLRMGLALVLTLFAATYRPQSGATTPDYVPPAMFAIAGALACVALLQARARFRGSRGVALLGYAVDAAGVLGASLLYTFDPRQYVPALLVVVQAEGGVVLGLGGGFLAWGLTSAAAVWIGFIDRSITGQGVSVLDEVIRIGVGLILSLGGAFLSDELAGQRDRRLALREQAR